MRLSCLARNGRSPGEESLAAAIAAQAIEAQPSFGQIKPMRGQVVAAPNSILETCQRAIGLTRGPAFQAKEKKTWRAERRPACLRDRRKPAHVRATTGLQSADEIDRLIEVSERTAMSRSCLTTVCPR